jgi:hypothetical protein
MVNPGGKGRVEVGGVGAGLDDELTGGVKVVVAGVAVGIAAVVVGVVTDRGTATETTMEAAELPALFTAFTR